VVECTIVCGSTDFPNFPITLSRDGRRILTARVAFEKQTGDFAANPVYPNVIIEKNCPLWRSAVSLECGSGVTLPQSLDDR
jgi:hypothetical protein